MDAMSMLNETMGYGRKVSSLGVRTYTESEGGLRLKYQLNMTVSAQVDDLSPTTEEDLVAFVTKKLGYTECVIDKRKNTIYVESIDGVDSSRVLKYIKRCIDKNARQEAKR